MGLGENQAAGAETGAANRARPNGTAPIYVGWACFIIAIIFVLLAIASQPESWEVGPYTTDTALASGVEKLARAWLYQMIAAAFFSLFLVLWSVGSIVRAIAHLPGKTDLNSLALILAEARNSDSRSSAPEISIPDTRPA